MSTRNADLSSLKIDSSKRDQPANPGQNKKIFYGLAGMLIVIILALLIFWVSGSLFSTTIEVQLASVTLQSRSQANAMLTASGYVVSSEEGSCRFQRHRASDLSGGG